MYIELSLLSLTREVFPDDTGSARMYLRSCSVVMGLGCGVFGVYGGNTLGGYGGLLFSFDAWLR
jgi:hypothetical protein